MQQFFSYTVSGLSTGSIYAIAALGLVLTYTTTGVFNFAHGAMSMLAAFTYWELRFGWHWPAPVALAVCLLVLAPLAGVALELGVMRRLQDVGDTTRLVVTIALMLGFVGVALLIWPPARSRPIRKFWEGRVFTLLDVRIPYHFAAAIVAAGLAAVALRVLLTRTRLGVAMRACVDDRSLAALNGARQSVIAMSSWAIGTVLAAAAGILVAPSLNLSALPLTLLVINSYAAAIAGHLRNLPITFVAALGLGLLTDYARGYADELPLETRYVSGFLASIPVIVLFIVLLVLPSTRLSTAARTDRQRVIATPSLSGGAFFAVAVVVGAVMLVTVVPRGDLFALGRVWGLGIVALSLIPLVGYAGQLSLCQLSFAGIGMVMVGHLGRDGNPLALVWAATVAALVGVLVALPSWRLSGIYLALSTAAFAVLMDRWLFAFPRFELFGKSWDVFPGGTISVRHTRFFGNGVSGFKAFFVFGAVAFALVSLLVIALRRATYGQRLIAMKDSEVACATLRMNPRLTKVGVFALSAAMAGFGGALYGQAQRVAPADSVQLLSSLSLLMVMVIAGATSPGAALFTGVFLGFQLDAVVFGEIADLLPSGFAHTLFEKLSTNTLLLVGLAGVWLGRHADGFIVSRVRPRWDPLLRRPAAVAGVAAALGVAYLLRITGALDNWAFALLTAGILAASPSAFRVLTEHHTPTPDRVAPEWLGLSVPATRADLVALERAMHLPEEVVTRGGSAR